MLDTVRVESERITRCAVSKIDLKGRFVYIDDETEDLLGCVREELFGSSIAAYLTDDSFDRLRLILNRRNRVESFFDALPLDLLRADGRPLRCESIVSLCFIAGNPVNYQVILVPSDEPGNRVMPPNFERQVLDLLIQRSGVSDFATVAELFFQAGDFGEVSCYGLTPEGDLKRLGMFPDREAQTDIPGHLRQYAREQTPLLAESPDALHLDDNVGGIRDEAAVCFRHGEHGPVIIQLRKRDGRLLTEVEAERLRWVAQICRQCGATHAAQTSAAARFLSLGRVAEALQIGIVIVTDDYQIVFHNAHAATILPGIDPTSRQDFRAVLKTLKVCRQGSESTPFQQSLLSQSIRNQEQAMARVHLPDDQRMLKVITGPLEADGRRLTAFCFIPELQEEELPQSYEAARKLIGIMAHDFNAPLITMAAFARQLQSHHADQLDEAGKFAVTCLRENAEILRRMLDGLGDMSRNWTDGGHPEPVAVRPLIDDLLMSLRSVYPGAQYRVVIANDLPEIIAPKGKLIQVFRNILDNAFKYASGTQPPTITISYEHTDGRHRFSISDNGPGVSEDYRRRIFDPFFRVPEPSVMEREGTGLGLAIVRDIVNGWGGQVWLENEGAGGLTILFTLPEQIPG